VRAIDALGVLTVSELRFSKFEFTPRHRSQIKLPDARVLVAAASATKRGRCARGMGVPVGSNAAAQ